MKMRYIWAWERDTELTARLGWEIVDPESEEYRLAVEFGPDEMYEEVFILDLSN